MSNLFKNIKEINISLEDAKVIIKEYVERDTERHVKDVVFDVGQQLTGYGQGEHYTTCLKQITIIFA